MKKTSILTVVLILAVSAAVFVYFRHSTSQTQPGKTSEVKAGEQATNQKESMNGALVPQDTASIRPFAVMIENHPDSRPQSGLSQADVVYEALAEGGITRFLALFQTAKPEEIGSIRSARDYFAELAEEWAAIYVHVGGSNEVIEQLKNNDYPKLSDANEYYNGDYFIRRTDKIQPHHVFTSWDKLQMLAASRNLSVTADFKPWLFQDYQPAASSTVSKIDIDFSRAGYEVGWRYDVSQNRYLRLQYFEPHKDAASKKQISASTVVIQLVKVTPVPNDKLLHVNIDMDSGGKAWVFAGGEVVEGIWKKQNGRTRFYNVAGEEIKLARGPVWVELVPQDKQENLKW